MCSDVPYLYYLALSNGSFQKTSIPPPRRKLEVNPPTPFGCPNTFTIIRNNFFSPPLPDGRNFFRGGSMDLFWNDPMPDIILLCLLIKHHTIYSSRRECCHSMQCTALYFAHCYSKGLNPPWQNSLHEFVSGKYGWLHMSDS